MAGGVTIAMAGGEFNHREYGCYKMLSAADRRVFDEQVMRIDHKIQAQRSDAEDGRIVHDLPPTAGASVAACLRDVYSGPGEFAAELLFEDGRYTLLLE